MAFTPAQKGVTSTTTARLTPRVGGAPKVCRRGHARLTTRCTAACRCGGAGACNSATNDSALSAIAPTSSSGCVAPCGGVTELMTRAKSGGRGSAERRVAPTARRKAGYVGLCASY